MIFQKIQFTQKGRKEILLIKIQDFELEIDFCNLKTFDISNYELCLKKK